MVSVATCTQLHLNSQTAGKHLHIDKLEEYGITEELNPNTDSEKSSIVVTLHHKTAKWENNKLEWGAKVSTDKACSRKFVREQKE